MRVRLPYLIQDKRVSVTKRLRPVESFHWNPESSNLEGWDAIDQPEVFLNGPVGSRVALLDFDEETGALEEPVEFKPGAIGEYLVSDDLGDRQFQAVSTFAIVMKTLREFETADLLGRRIEWAFPGTQLLVVPRAGEWANAFYERESGSLQFFSFNDDHGNRIHSSQSFDIVAHETGHAILDAIAPSLYDTITPESLALHEAVADITALVMSVSSRTLRETLLSQTGDVIHGMNAFTWIAEEFGKARGGRDGDPYLRDLSNDLTMKQVDESSPHELSQVLSGALFQLLSWIFERRKQKVEAGEYGDRGPEASLAIANNIFRRVAMRALDYLPPGEISFSDYGRAVWAADQSSNPDSPEFRNFLADEFVRRGIVDSADELHGVTVDQPDALHEVDLDALIHSDWVAYDFANNHRELLEIPEHVSGFRVLDRLDITKVTYRTVTGKHRYREVLFKVGWEESEDNPVSGLPNKRGVNFGTTLAVNRETGDVTALVTTNRSRTGVDQSRQRTDRIEALMANDQLDPRTNGVAELSTSQGIVRVTGSGRSLHMTSADGFQLRKPGGSE